MSISFHSLLSLKLPTLATDDKRVFPCYRVASNDRHAEALWQCLIQAGIGVWGREVSAAKGRQEVRGTRRHCSVLCALCAMHQKGCTA